MVRETSTSHCVNLVLLLKDTRRKTKHIKHNHSSLTEASKIKTPRHLGEIKLNFLTIFQTFCSQSGINLQSHTNEVQCQITIANYHRQMCTWECHNPWVV